MYVGGRGWDKNESLRLPVGVTPAGISLNHPGINTQVFGPRYREGHTQQAGFFARCCTADHNHLAYHCSQKGSLLLCDISGTGSLWVPALSLHHNMSLTH